MDLTMERFLAWKILPRCMMAAFTLMAWNVCDWFMALGPDATTQQTAFVSTIVGAANMPCSLIESGTMIQLLPGIARPYRGEGRKEKAKSKSQTAVDAVSGIDHG